MALSAEALRKLIQYVVSEVIDQGGEIWLTRLVKLLYLIDVEYYRAVGRTLTGLRWIRYFYGPYVVELPELARRSGCDLGSEELPFGRHGTRVSVEPPYDIDRTISSFAKATADRVIRRWALESLDVMLDFVYLETEPMKRAEMNQPLDFTKIEVGKHRLTQVPPLKLSAEDSREVKNNMATRKRSTVSLARNPITNVEVVRVLAALSDEDNVVDPTGSVKVPKDEFRGTDYQE